jgi:esterase/lipase
MKEGDYYCFLVIWRESHFVVNWIIMIGNLSASMNDTIVRYPISDSGLPFADYIAYSQALIKERRTDLQASRFTHPEHIIDANSPFEFYPVNPIKQGERIKYGALLIHGLFDCPFSFRDIGHRLQHQGILCRSILLPGHGTTPSDLLNVSYHDWIQATRYGIETLKRDVDQLFLVGYSTGAALSVYHALHDTQIAGVVLLAPAIKIKAPVDTLFSWRYLVKWLSSNRQWIYREDEIDYAKYLSIAFNPVSQVNNLTDVINELHQQRSLDCPVLMVMSREDETVSSHMAIDFFSSLPNPKNRMLLYTGYDHRYPDARILPRLTHYPDLHTQHFSHVAIPFAPNNQHYGQEGDYKYASRINQRDVTYGAYNRLEESSYDFLYQLGLLKYKRRQLTYNPDFDYMANMIHNFIIQT